MENISSTIQKTTVGYPEKVLQFGAGNFLRAFADWMVDKANRQGVYHGSIVICQAIAQGAGERINSQSGLYTLVMRGIENGQSVEKAEVISSVSRCINPYEDYDALLSLARSADLEVIVSNTTEAGISYHAGDSLTDRPPHSFPAKVCAFLYERYQAFNGAADKGLLFLPVELIDNNGAELKRIVLQYAHEWQLGDAFSTWVSEYNHFCSTLVDRIVPGYPRDQVSYFEEKLGYEDKCLVTSELFNLWVIEGKKEWADILPIDQTDAHVIWTDDVTPYKKRKVRILNGGHTSSVLAAYLAGHESVLDMMNDDVFKRYLDKVLYDEVIPTLDMPRSELLDFAAEVENRFRNPYIKHYLLDISLNSCSKWCTRVMPSLLGYVEKNGQLPTALTFSLAAFIRFYQGRMINNTYTGTRFDGKTYPIRDSEEVIDFFSHVWNDNLTTAQITQAVLGNRALWNDHDLTQLTGLPEAVAGYLDAMSTRPMQDVVASLL